MFCESGRRELVHLEAGDAQGKNWPSVAAKTGTLTPAKLALKVKRELLLDWVKTKLKV